MVGITGTSNTTVAIDNFGTIGDVSVPEPSTIFLLGLSSIFLWKGRLK
jgi:hypothetical protein